MAFRALAVAVLVAALVAPAVTAHTSVTSSDGEYRIVVGQLEEPVVTHQKTGLDLCFTLNDAARTPLTINPGDFEGTAGFVKLKSPSGQELSMGLRSQFGRPGCYQFTDPYILTEPGQYTLDFAGNVNGTAVQFAGVNAGGVVVEAATIAFPGALDAASQELAANVTALAARVAQLESDLETAMEKKESEFAPGAPAALLMVGLAGLVAVLRRRV